MMLLPDWRTSCPGRHRTSEPTGFARSETREGTRTMAEPMFAQAVIDAYVDAGWWGTDALADLVAGHAATRPDDPAYTVADESGDGVLTWAQYLERSSELASVFVQAGLDPGTRIGVILPDGATVHTVLLAAEKAGLVVAGIGARAGPAEIRHLLGRM